MLYRKFFKRFLDIFFSLILLLIILPIIIIICIILFFANNGKIFFVQRRPGKNEKVFSILKFKTMNDKKNEKGEFLPENERITRIGKFIRQSSIDEFPQLVNVLKGDLSLIGPRPLLVDYLPLYNDFQRRRHEVKPGITGWAQIKGRNSISWKQKFEYDCYYVENVSFLFDIKIMILTLKKVFCPEGINSSKDVTMVTFNGHN